MGDWLKNVVIDSATWFWARRRYRGLVAQRLKNGYRIIGVLADFADEAGQ